MRKVLSGLILPLLFAVFGCQIAKADPATGDVSRLAESLHTQLEGEVVGYSFAIGKDASIKGAGGFARTPADGASFEFEPETPMIVASVSKWITAIATMAVLQDASLSIHEPIGPYFPGDWQVSPSVAEITFAELMSHKSGIRAFGNGPGAYGDLRDFFTQTVEPGARADCQRLGQPLPNAPIAPESREFCYSNLNYAILRVLLPKVADEPLLYDGKVPGQAFAEAYERLVRRRVFHPLGLDATCAPTNDGYALSYIYPGEKPGKDWGERYAGCATGGWYVSAVDLTRLIGSIASRDGQILRENEVYSSLAEMRSFGLGATRNGPDMMEKGGLLGDDPGVLSVSAMIFRPDDQDALPIVLMINSTNSDIEIANARIYIERALNDAGLR